MHSAAKKKVEVGNSRSASGAAGDKVSRLRGKAVCIFIYLFLLARRHAL